MKQFICKIEMFVVEQEVFCANEDGTTVSIGKFNTMELGKELAINAVANEVEHIHLYGNHNFILNVIDDIHSYVNRNYSNKNIEIEVN